MREPYITHRNNALGRLCVRWRHRRGVFQIRLHDRLERIATAYEVYKALGRRAYSHAAAPCNAEPIGEQRTPGTARFYMEYRE